MQPAILDHLPDALLSLPATELHRHLDGPTLIHLPGRLPQPLFVSVLQHGNETSGWEAVKRLLRSRYRRDPLPRSLILLIANVEAAAQVRRHLPDQPDFNRCWPGSELEPGPWHRMFAWICDHVRQFKPFASIDIHNNTGENPHYAAVNRIEAQRLHLASMFSNTVIYFTQPSGVQSMAFGEFCPAVTLECGLAAQTDGADHAMAYLEHVLNLRELPKAMPQPDDLELFRMIATVTVDQNLRFGFSESAGDVWFPPDLDRLNFREMPPGTRLARLLNGHENPLKATSHEGGDVSAHCFRTHERDIITTRPLMPAMMTTDEQIIRQDCLCHLMERLSPAHPVLEDISDEPELPETQP
ncbi:M14 family metallopeptidase [Wenzhouxiangella marina]|uniref:Peptidase M14 n=1 Tax=Wenzhouxiangella marina TaxID=1579979 RepID=A0A0K0XWP5_9GAMM|nr:M14 family metallopeptidase [Wenzhouxiangella marina]AKS42124.1 peptidase M14 [Wenzhouxiangella marina]MBB6086104.1 succinylglutamate desuccinylase [Wenzhouxiangella marina]